MRVYESAEDYLEAILVIGRRRGTVRSIDIANELHFSKPRESGHIEMDQDGLIRLLPSGQTVAEQIYERHRMLTEFFIYLGIDEASASADACRVEHDLSPETFEKLKEHIRRTIGETPGKAEK